MKQTIRLLKELGKRRRAMAWPAIRGRIMREIAAREMKSPPLPEDFSVKGVP